MKYKFRLVLEETFSYGVLGRTGRGITEHQNVDATLVDMIIGSLAGPVCAGGGFCAGNADIVDHQRISSSAYTFSASLPAMQATTASETLLLLQENPDLIKQLRENTRIVRAQLDPRSEWVRCTSTVDNPCQILVLKPEVVASRGLSIQDQEVIMQDVVDEVCCSCLFFPVHNISSLLTLWYNQALANGVLITRLKAMPLALGVGAKDQGWQPQPALKVCIMNGLTRKELERAGTVVRHAVTKAVGRRR